MIFPDLGTPSPETGLSPGNPGTTTHAVMPEPGTSPDSRLRCSDLFPMLLPDPLRHNVAIVHDHGEIFCPQGDRVVRLDVWIERMLPPAATQCIDRLQPTLTLPYGLSLWFIDSASSVDDVI